MVLFSFDLGSPWFTLVHLSVLFVAWLVVGCFSVNCSNCQTRGCQIKTTVARVGSAFVMSHDNSPPPQVPGFHIKSVVAFHGSDNAGHLVAWVEEDAGRFRYDDEVKQRVDGDWPPAVLVVYEADPEQEQEQLEEQEQEQEQEEEQEEEEEEQEQLEEQDQDQDQDQEQEQEQEKDQEQESFARLLYGSSLHAVLDQGHYEANDDTMFDQALLHYRSAPRPLQKYHSNGFSLRSHKKGEILQVLQGRFIPASPAFRANTIGFNDDWDFIYSNIDAQSLFGQMESPSGNVEVRWHFAPAFGCWVAAIQTTKRVAVNSLLCPVAA